MEHNEPQTRRLAVITGADGGMGTEITRAVAQAGYHVIMASCRKQKAEAVRRTLLHDRSDLQIEVRRLDLASLASVAAGISPKTDWNVRSVSITSVPIC